MRNLKKVLLAGLVLSFSVSSSIMAFAGQWERDSTGWWYQNDDGTYAADGWQWINAEGTGDSYCYYFDENGYMAADTITPDGYEVNADGAWIDGGILQKRSETPEEDLDKQKERYEEEREMAIEEAKENLYDAEDESFSKRRRAAFEYLQALGYQTDRLTIDRNHIDFEGGFMLGGGASSLYNLLAYNDESVLYRLMYYANGSESADDLIEAVEDYIYR